MRFVPLHMDEFFQYHNLACWAYPLNAFNVFIEGCGAHDLNLFNSGWVLPVRTFAYAGSLPSLYYAPLLYLWPSPASAAFLGYLFLLLEAEMLRRIVGIAFWKILLFLLLLLPYAVLHLADTGPVAFQCLSIFLLFLLIRRWTRSLHWTPAVLSCVIVALGVWTKLTYIWLLPGIAIMGVLLMWEERTHLFGKKRRFQTAVQLCAWTSFAILLLFLYFHSTEPGHPDHFPLWNEILRGKTYTLGEFLRGEWSQSHVIRTFLHPLEVVARNRHAVLPYGFVQIVFSGLLYLFVPISLLFVPWTGKARTHAIRAIVLYGAFLLTAAIIVDSKDAWSTHHAVLSYPFLLLSIGSVVRIPAAGNLRGAWRCWAGVFCVMSLLLYLRIPSVPRQVWDDDSKRTVNHVLSDPYLAEHYVYVIANWGMYYIQSLYGNSAQAVLYSENSNDLDRIRKIAERLDRQLLFVYVDPGRVSAARQILSLSSCAALPANSAWSIALERTADPGNPCFADAKIPQ